MMHPERLSYLACHHPVKRKIVSKNEIQNGFVTFMLECGHEGHGVNHFDYKNTEEWTCHKCSEENVRTDPRWAAEFAA